MRTFYITDDNKDKVEKVNFVHANGTTSEGYVVTDKELFEKAKRERQEKMQTRKDNLYMVFLSFGILSFALGSYISYKRLKGN
jgi:hypothetical protein